MEERVLNRVIEVSPAEAKLLEWLGQWTPAVHKADWENRRSWPPGYREIADTSVYHAGSGRASDEEKEARLAVPPVKNARNCLTRLLAAGLIEGHAWAGVVRLTATGRAAVMLQHLGCPDTFVSHAPNVFDNVDLRPRVTRGIFEFCGREDREMRVGTLLPDEEASWRLMLREYKEDDQRVRGMPLLHRAQARMSICEGERALHGSLRMHRRYVHVTIENAAGKDVCEFAMSLEGLTDLLVSNMAVPVTLDHYFDHEGMLQSEPALPPTSISDRMQARMEQTDSDRDARVRELEEQLRALKVSDKKKTELLKNLELIADMERSNLAFRVQQAAEEVGSLVDGAMTIVSERMGQGLGTRPLAGLLDAPTQGLPAHTDPKDKEN